MGRTREIIQEIEDIRQRRRFGLAMSELTMRLFALEDAFKKHGGAESEIIRYFPVALIACVEGYVRMVIKDLIDSGEPYLTNAEKPASSLKLDFSLLRAVHGKAVTVGELVAHGVPLSRLEHIEGVLSSLLGKGFLDTLRNTTDRWAHEIKGEPATPILAQPDTVFSDVAKTFELRHIICHEIASAYDIEAKQVAQCFESCVSFLRATDELISETLHPGAPLTQADMNISAGKSLGEKEQTLEQAIVTLKARLDSQEAAAFEEAQHRWEHYRDAWVSFVADALAAGGSIWPMIHSNEARAVAERRIEEVEQFTRLSDPG